MLKHEQLEKCATCTVACTQRIELFLMDYLPLNSSWFIFTISEFSTELKSLKLNSSFNSNVQHNFLALTMKVIPMFRGAAQLPSAAKVHIIFYTWSYKAQWAPMYLIDIATYIYLCNCKKLSK